MLRRIAAGADRLDEVLLAAVAVAARLEQPLRARADAGSERAGALATELARVGALEHEARTVSTTANERAGAAELTRVRLGGEGQIRLLHVEETERDSVEQEARELTAEAERLAGVAAEAGEAARSAAAAQAATGALRAAARDVDLLRRILAGAERLDETLAAAAGTAERFEAPLRARVDAGASRTGELGAALRELGAAEVELRQGAEDAAQRATEIEIELTRIEADAADARRRLEEAAAEAAEGDDRDELAARAERLETRRIQLGQVNPLAKEEYEAEKERLAELETQREDLELSLKELADLRDELAATVERRFADTYAAVAEHFEEVAATLFPGGEGRLRLVAPDEEGGETGVEVELRPAGQEDHSARNALRRREGARSDLVPLRALPGEAVPVLPPRRGRGGARRRQHRPLRRAAAPLLRSRSVRRDHASEADDGGRRRALRRHHGRRRHQPDRLAPASARGGDGARTLTWTVGAESVTVVERGPSCRREIVTATSFARAPVLLGSALLLTSVPGAAAAEVAFGPVTDYAVGTSPLSVAVADFDGDLDLDLAVANGSSGNVSILLGAGDGTFGPASNLAAGSNPVSVAIGDFNGDGDPDLAAARSGVSSFNVMVRLGGPGASFGPADFYDAGDDSGAAEIGDVNLDGDPDLVVVNRDSDDISVLLGGAGGTFGPAASFPAGDSPIAVALADVNGDGDLDLAISNLDPGLGEGSVLLGGAGGAFGVPATLAVNLPKEIEAADFNGDGDPTSRSAASRRNRWRSLSVARAAALARSLRCRPWATKRSRSRSATSTATASSTSSASRASRAGCRCCAAAATEPSTSTQTSSTIAAARRSPSATSMATATSISPSRARTSSPSC